MTSRHLAVDDGLLIRYRLGGPQSPDPFYDIMWRPSLVAAGLRARRFTFHELRHFTATA